MQSQTGFETEMVWNTNTHKNRRTRASVPRDFQQNQSLMWRDPAASWHIVVFSPFVVGLQHSARALVLQVSYRSCCASSSLSSGRCFKFRFHFRIWLNYLFSVSETLSMHFFLLLQFLNFFFLHRYRLTGPPMFSPTPNYITNLFLGYISRDKNSQVA